LIEPWQTCPYEAEPGEWTIEWVGTLPQHRRRGLVDRLLAAILAKGRETGHPSAHVSVLIGNDAAQRAYEKAGFVAYEDVRHPEFERAARAPGMRKLRRPL
jgi:ribosomal protein S18 acetylase RimI-like enzyme